MNTNQISNVFHQIIQLIAAMIERICDVLNVNEFQFVLIIIAIFALFMLKIVVDAFRK